MYRQLARTLSWAVASAAIALALAEVAIHVFGLFPEGRAASVLARPEGEAGAEPGKFQIHPFLGWTWRPGLRASLEAAFPEGEPTEWARRNSTVNRLGHFSWSEDYREIGEDAFVVGIFGGSVASDLASLGGEVLREALQARLPELGESIVVFNLATRGHKQPQQAIALLQALVLGLRFDAVVNLDGFNEAVHGGRDVALGRHPLFPARRLWTSALELSSVAPAGETLELAGEVARVRRRARELAAWIQESVLARRSKLARAVAGMRVLRQWRRADELEDRLQQLSAERPASAAVASLTDPCLEGRGSCLELIADLWQRSSRLMHDLTREGGGVYLHALQPNQYVPGSKRLTAEERRRSYVPGGRSDLVERVYPLFRRRSASLADHGVTFHDLTMIFADRPETIYRDPCCHYNLHGNELLARRLADLIGDAVTAAGRPLMTAAD